MLRCLVYTAALSLTVGALQVAQAGGEFRARGVVLPNGAVRIADDRYRLPDPWEATLKYYRGIYRLEKFPRKAIVNQPGIKAVHVDNPDVSGEWEGYNIYEYQGEVRLYVLAREKKP